MTFSIEQENSLLFSRFDPCQQLLALVEVELEVAQLIGRGREEGDERLVYQTQYGETHIDEGSEHGTTNMQRGCVVRCRNFLLVLIPEYTQQDEDGQHKNRLLLRFDVWESEEHFEEDDVDQC